MKTMLPIVWVCGFPLHQEPRLGTLGFYVCVFVMIKEKLLFFNMPKMAKPYEFGGGGVFEYTEIKSGQANVY